MFTKKKVKCVCVCVCVGGGGGGGGDCVHVSAFVFSSAPSCVRTYDTVFMIARGRYIKLPFNFVTDKFSMKVPWSNLYWSNLYTDPVIAEIDGVYIVAGPASGEPKGLCRYSSAAAFEVVSTVQCTCMYSLLNVLMVL